MTHERWRGDYDPQRRDWGERRYAGTDGLRDRERLFRQRWVSEQLAGTMGRSFNDRWENAYGPRTPREVYGRDRTMEPGYSLLRHGADYRSDSWRRDQEPSWQRNAMQGSYRGRGPKGYRRADERIRDEVCERLTMDDHIDATHIEVTVQDGEVTLAGRVNSRHEKRWAEDLIEHIAGVRDVHNNLRVSSASSERLEGTMSSTPSPSVRH